MKEKFAIGGGSAEEKGGKEKTQKKMSSTEGMKATKTGKKPVKKKEDWDSSGIQGLGKVCSSKKKKITLWRHQSKRRKRKRQTRG